ncbi:sporulation kinase [Desulfocucumis palustris]|uniref:histidine kinase n=1 Tax=Desulfocucumis palustris TaxID=1898651 RepID=A0A2L2XAS4_9FIRM|nr:PAS domain S-box protein [Desulfocucumis palustris]GBF33379.1 sporulation kinase [Desulfocucumis palustris]
MVMVPEYSPDEVTRLQRKVAVYRRLKKEYREKEKELELLKEEFNNARREMEQLGLYPRVFEEKGKLSGICRCAVDISEYVRWGRQAERALWDQINFMQTLIDTIPSPIFYKDINGVYQGCNNAFCSLVGINREDIIGKTVHYLFPRELSAIYSEKDLLLLEKPGFQMYESRVKNAGGTYRDVIFYKATYIDTEGKAAGIVGVAIDITERKGMEEDLRLSEERFKKAFNASPAGIFIHRAMDRRIIDVNDSFILSSGYSREELIGRSIDDVDLWVNPEDNGRVYEYILKGGSVHNLEVRYYGKNGEIRTGLFSAEIIVIDGEECVLSLFFDTTENDRLKSELARLNRLSLVGEMAAGIGHEIRNPMTTVRGFLQMLGGKEGFVNYREYFDVMISELDRANSIITEFLGMAGNKQANLKSRNINDIIGKITPLILADANNLEMSLKIATGNIPDILLDEKELRQLIFNLVRNGFEAMSPGGELTVATFMDNGEVVLSVKDQGKGIPPETLDRIGTPFYTTKESGTGLGLATCHSIASRHRAKIEVVSSPGETIFYVRFKSAGETAATDDFRAG